MHVRNVHQRSMGSPEHVGALLDALGSDTDRLWPSDRWPRLRLDGPLDVGARGGHGPIRYTVELYEPSRRVRFRFERPRGFAGFHEFHVAADDEQATLLVHVLEAHMSGSGLLSWPLVFRPLHNALIEDALDNAERHITGDPQHPARWSTYVRGLRRILAAARAVARRRGPAASRTPRTQRGPIAGAETDSLIAVKRLGGRPRDGA